MGRATKSGKDAAVASDFRVHGLDHCNNVDVGAGRLR
jgi:hypothetical protein